MATEGLESATADLLAAAGITDDFGITPLPGGANNQVYRFDVERSAFLLKSYFRHADDPRDRLGAEFSFSEFAWSNGLRCLPRPLARDDGRGLGLYEFIAGERVTAADVTDRLSRQALDFYLALNRHRHSPEAARLSAASEACFAVGSHLRRVGQRVERLAAIETDSRTEQEARRFVLDELLPAWDKVRDFVEREVARTGLAVAQELPPDERCVSPSDFGFHNAILGEDGLLRFIDFEYAGWDDPARMVCDFFCQPAVPLPASLRDHFAEAAMAEMREPDYHFRRIGLLLPVYQLKWCCILLNEFLPVSSRRRLFAASERSLEERRTAQLQKARRALSEAAVSRLA